MAVFLFAPRRLCYSAWVCLWPVSTVDCASSHVGDGEMIGHNREHRISVESDPSRRWSSGQGSIARLAALDERRVRYGESKRFGQ